MFLATNEQLVNQADNRPYPTGMIIARLFVGAFRKNTVMPGKIANEIRKNTESSQPEIRSHTEDSPQTC